MGSPGPAVRGHAVVFVLFQAASSCLIYIGFTSSLILKINKQMNH